jgi:hypothetical protein
MARQVSLLCGYKEQKLVSEFCRFPAFVIYHAVLVEKHLNDIYATLVQDYFDQLACRSMQIARFDPKARGIDCAVKRDNVIGAKDQRTTSGPTGDMTRIDRPKT